MTSNNSNRTVRVVTPELMKLQNLDPTLKTTAQNQELPTLDPVLKYIIIDGSNVAIEHGNTKGRFFSCMGIKLVVDYFLNRGHVNIKVMIPRFRRGSADLKFPTLNPEILDELEKHGYLTYTPSRYVQNKLVCPYDDRFILKAALYHNAIIVSNDNYRDLMKENLNWKQHIENNLLQYAFVDDLFLIADDPLGKNGPNLNQYLSNNTNENNYTQLVYNNPQLNSQYYNITL